MLVLFHNPIKTKKDTLTMSEEPKPTTDRPSNVESEVPTLGTYDVTSPEVTPEQHKRNQEILAAIERGERKFSLPDARAAEAQDVFHEESKRAEGMAHSGSRQTGMQYDGFVDIDAYGRSQDR